MLNIRLRTRLVHFGWRNSKQRGRGAVESWALEVPDEPRGEAQEKSNQEDAYTPPRDSRQSGILRQFPLCWQHIHSAWRVHHFSYIPDGSDSYRIPRFSRPAKKGSLPLWGAWDLKECGFGSYLVFSKEKGSGAYPEPLSFIGRSGEIRTPDPHNPIVVRYQAALRSENEGSMLEVHTPFVNLDC